MKLNIELVFDFMSQNIVNERTGESREFTTNNIADALKMQRSNVSALLNQLNKDRKIEKIEGRPVKYRVRDRSTDLPIENSCFNRLIGHNGSLRQSIQLAKASILYPEKSLNSLIIGPMGSGKSFFASLMHEFAVEKEIIRANAPFIKFNCIYYERDDMDEQSVYRIFETYLNSAQGGVLFVDHFDLLPVRARDLLYSKMVFKEDEVSPIIICVINDDVKPNLKQALQSQFSVKIELPSLIQRDLSERLNLVSDFFNHESLRIKKALKINSELLRCILLYNAEGNVKQLMNDIKIGCAKAYVRDIDVDTNELNIYMNDFPPYVRKGFLYYKDYREVIEELIPDNYSYRFFNEKMELEKEKTNTDKLTVYDIIDQKVNELRNRGIDKEDINTIINTDISSDFKKNHLSHRESNNDIESISKLVDKKIIVMVDEFLGNASVVLKRVFSKSTYYGLCMHLSATLERDTATQLISNSQILETVEQFNEEYGLSKEFCNEIEKQFEIRLPIDEVIFITMFVCDENLYSQALKAPNVVVAMHGDSTATSMVDVVKSLLKTENCFPFDLVLDTNMKNSYEKFKKTILEADSGEGILLLYDMGSLKTMAEMVIQECGVKIQMLELPGTLVALDASRKALSSKSLSDLYNSVRYSYDNHANESKYRRPVEGKAIITLCMTGKGAAIQMKNYLEKNLNQADVEIIPLAISDKENLLNEVNQIKKSKDILYLVGTYDPKLHSIPFISVTKLFDTPIDKLDYLLALENSEVKRNIDYDAIYLYLEEQLLDLNIIALKKTLPDLMKNINIFIERLSQDQEVGLFLHIACAIPRIQNNEPAHINANRGKILSSNKVMYNKLKELVFDLEAEFMIEFDDDEICSVISIIKQL